MTLVSRYSARLCVNLLYTSAHAFERLLQYIGPDKDAYYHELFLRSQRSLANQIPRTSVKGQGPRRPSSSEDEPNFYTMEYLPADPATTSGSQRQQPQPQQLPPPQQQQQQQRTVVPTTDATTHGTDHPPSDSSTRDWDSKPQPSHPPLATIDSMSNMYVQGNPLSHWSSGSISLLLHSSGTTTMAALDSALQSTTTTYSATTGSSSTTMAQPPKTHILAAAAANVLGHAPLLPAQIIQPSHTPSPQPPTPPPLEPSRCSTTTHVSAAAAALERPSSSSSSSSSSYLSMQHQSKSPWKPPRQQQPHHYGPTATTAGPVVEHPESSSPWYFQDPPR
jgi:hypothetical protein